MNYKTGMVFGIYDQIKERHINLIKSAARLCETIYIAVSSDEEIEIIFKQPSKVKLEGRIKIIQAFCQKEKMNAGILGAPGKYPKNFIQEKDVDIYVLSKSQYIRFGKELKDVCKTYNLKGRMEIVNV